MEALSAIACYSLAERASLRQAGGRVQGELSSVAAVLEIEHLERRSGDRVEGRSANPAEIPVLLDELQNGSLIGDGMVDEIHFRLA